MKFFTLLLSVALLAGTFLAVSGKNANEQQIKVKVASMPVVKPTEAPLMTSTVSPTRAPKTNPTPKPVTTKTTAKSNNVAKKSTPKMYNTTEKKIEIKMTEKTPMVFEKEIKMENAMPIAMPATVEPVKSMEIKEAKPLAVTGFITQSGNIYEIEDKQGMGKIQGRQAEDDKEHICNYGSVVIYSDVPCDQINNIKVSGIVKTPALDEKPEKPVEPAVEKEEIKPQENNDKETEEDLENLASAKPNKRRRNNKRRNRNKNQKSKLQQQKKNKNRRNKNGANRPNQNRNQNRRRVQQQGSNQQKRRRQQQNRRQQQQNRREWEDDQWQDELQSQRRRNQRRRQQANRQRFSEDDE